MSAIGCDVAVIGGGPAGWAAARACAAAGLDAVIVADDRPWPATYSCWADELDAIGLGDATAQRYERVTVIGGAARSVDRTYALVDNAALASRLRSDAVAGGVRRVTGELGAHRRAPDHHELTVGEQRVISSMVVDATGHRPRLVWRGETRSGVAVQAAYGLVARLSRPPVEPGECVLMDWRPAPGADGRTPTFLYVLGLGDGWFLVEETSLALAPAMSLGELRRRLERRLADRRIEVLEVRHTETVHIPMDLPVPSPQSVVGFGAAGGFVNPTTGYSLVASLRLAPVLADAIVRALGDRRTGDDLSFAVWAALWPAERRRARALHTYGLGVLSHLDAEHTAAFFDTFFQLPPQQWADYVDPVPSLDATIAVMRAMFLSAPWSIRGRLMGGDLRWLARASAIGR